MNSSNENILFFRDKKTIPRLALTGKVPEHGRVDLQRNQSRHNPNAMLLLRFLCL